MNGYAYTQTVWTTTTRATCAFSRTSIGCAFLRFSRLSIVNSLVDARVSAGVEFSFGNRSLDLRFARWRTEVDQGDIDSIGIGFLTPISDAADIEIRAAYDDSDNFGGATVLSFFLYLYSE